MARQLFMRMIHPLLPQLPTGREPAWNETNTSSHPSPSKYSEEDRGAVRDPSRFNPRGISCLRLTAVWSGRNAAGRLLKDSWDRSSGLFLSRVCPGAKALRTSPLNHGSTPWEPQLNQLAPTPWMLPHVAVGRESEAAAKAIGAADASFPGPRDPLRALLCLQSPCKRAK